MDKQGKEIQEQDKIMERIEEFYSELYDSDHASSSFSVQGSVFRRIDALLGELRVGGGVHDSYTFQCGLVGSFTSPGIDTR